MPTGGIDLENMDEYFRCGAVGVGMGSNLLHSSAIKQKQWDEVTRFALPFSEAARRPAT